MRTSSLMKRRGSRIRGHVLKLVRGQIVATYGFSRQTTPAAIAKNCLLSAQLVKDGAFHYKNPETLSGYAQNKIISEIVHLAWFEDASSSGISFSQYFNPITLNTFALIFTLVEACIREWSTGKSVKTDFSEKVYTSSYRAHQANLEHWSSLNPTVVENIRRKLYKRARRNAGVSDDLAPTIHLMGEAEARVRSEMEGRTGETDSEMSAAE